MSIAKAVGTFPPSLGNLTCNSQGRGLDSYSLLISAHVDLTCDLSRL